VINRINFSLEIIKFCRKLINRKEFVIGKQLLKSGTSVGANIEEAQQAQSKKDFVSKLSISLKEASETRYWLMLIRDSNLAQKNEVNLLLQKIAELIRLLVSIIKSSK